MEADRLFFLLAQTAAIALLAAGGTQEECMFTEFPELLASIYVTERLRSQRKTSNIS